MYHSNPKLNIARVKIAGKWVLIDKMAIPGADMSTFGKFSTKTDMNKKTLFEGDIVEFVTPNDFGSYTPRAGVMIFDENEAGFLLDVFAPETKGGGFVGVIHNSVLKGTIYDNPELVEHYAKIHGGLPLCLRQPPQNQTPSNPAP